MNIFEDTDQFLADIEAGTVERDAADAKAERRGHLEAMKAQGGTLGLIASELLVRIDENEAKAKAAEAIAQSEADVASGVADWSDEAFLDGLRQAVLVDRETAAAEFDRWRKAELVSKHGEVDGPIVFEQERKARAETAWFENGTDPLLSSPVWVAHQVAEREAQRAASTARNLSMTTGYGDALAEAEAGIAESLAEALA